MATVKAYTDLEQSKKLAEILPLESADMTYCAITEGVREKMIIKDWQVNFGLDVAITENLFSYRNGYMVPCWSIAALLNVLPKGTNISTPDPLNKIRYSCWNDYDITYASNPVDACVAMIECLHELNLL